MHLDVRLVDALLDTGEGKSPVNRKHHDESDLVQHRDSLTGKQKSFDADRLEAG